MKNKNILGIFLAVTIVLLGGTIYFVNPDLQKGQLQYDQRASQPESFVPSGYPTTTPRGTPTTSKKSGPLPDLIISTIFHEDNARGSLWHVQVKNVGAESAQKKFQIILNGTVSQNNVIRLLPVNPRATGSFESEINGLCVQCAAIVTFEAPYTSTPLLLLEGMVDNNDTVLESNEGNNTFVLKNNRK